MTAPHFTYIKGLWLAALFTHPRELLGSVPVFLLFMVFPEVSTLQDVPTARAFYRLIRTIRPAEMHLEGSGEE